MFVLLLVTALVMGVNCEEVCSNLSGSCNALVLYDENKPLAEFYKKVKKFSFTSVGEIKILQEYDNHGVAGVVWEGVSFISRSFSIQKKLKK